MRTSGEYRLSNYLLWQLAYAELYFTDVLWPDFKRDHLYEAVKAYQTRDRRFGGLNERVNDPPVVTLVVWRGCIGTGASSSAASSWGRRTASSRS